MYEPASLGMFQCRLQRILCDFEVIMFFRKDPPQTEGRRHADLLIKTPPDHLKPSDPPLKQGFEELLRTITKKNYICGHQR